MTVAMEDRTWDRLSARVGRRDLPLTLIYAVLIDQVLTDREEIARGIEHAWTATEWPLSAAEPGVWTNVFAEAAGPGEYLEGDQIADQADLPEMLVVFRGAAPGYEQGMSWTTDLDRAHWFANRFNQGHAVYMAQVPREAVLARFNRRGESEVVIDPDFLPEDVEDMETVPLNWPTVR